MPFNPFNTLTGKHACTLFEIRRTRSPSSQPADIIYPSLDDDFIIFRGNEHEAAGQLMKGTIVLCLPSPLKVEDIHLRLTGQLRLAWTHSKATPSGITTQRVDRTKVVYNHQWNPFVAPKPGSSSKSVTLEAGNYEWPFELLLPGSTAESVEGLPDTSLIYKLKATIARGKLAYDLHAYKHLRIVRTLEPAALEFLHAMSVENIWVNKIEYSIVIPQKAVVFGGTVPLDMRFTPLLKALDMGDITVKLVEIQEFNLQGPYGYSLKEHRHEREVEKWSLKVDRSEHWHDILEETGQEGWVVHAPLPLPKRLRDCIQDVNMPGVKIRHKLRLNVALRNPDGHISELRATLPITIFISPNMLLDDQGNLVRQQPGVTSSVDAASVAPPGYGEHILDQLYDDVPMTGFQSPPLQSGINSPFYSQSRVGSAENLPSLTGGMHDGVAPAALSSRLQNVAAVNGNSSVSPRASLVDQSNRTSTLASAELSRRPSNEDHDSSDSVARATRSGYHTPEHIDYSSMEDLSRVPSYATAVRTPARNLHVPSRNAPPDYRIAVSVSAPSSPTHRDTDPMSTSAPGMETIHESTSSHNAEGWADRRRTSRDSGSSRGAGGSSVTGSRGASSTHDNSNNSSNESPRTSFMNRSRTTSMGLGGFLSSHLHISDPEERRLHLIQASERVM
ncbi:carbon catabolite repression protein [Zalerion maritima]|uniref:Carbon catabolite repression protein n=1 Tax=Zalerion maritima TaxID=339359 RepID=A0AAD5WUX9_9PEZI|nr:carbon catabolite repression protein [Zalerion maritima]